MLYFFDTSALVKQYHLEVGSDVVDKIFNDTRVKIITASITWSEAVSVFNKLCNRDIISKNELKIIISKLSLDFYTGKIGIIDIARKHIIDSHDLILAYNLSSSDAIVLAIAIVLKPFEPVFVCSDVRSGVLRAAEKSDISTLNPIS